MEITQIVEKLREFASPEAITIILSALPVSELRGAIPVAMGVFKFSAAKSFLLAVFGNMLPVPVILFFLENTSSFLSAKWSPAEKFFRWLFERTRKKFYKKHSIYGDIVLIVFVAIPLPATGAWTGSVAAFLFGIKKLPAFGYIFAGVIIAGIIVTSLCAGAISFF